MQAELRQAYRLMRRAHGHLKWWPADSPFEICVGAILTQNTSWKNVEHALANLKSARVLTPKKIYNLSNAKLSQLIRPAGYFNIKAKRLRNFVDVLVEQHRASLKHLFNGNTAIIRERLLAINGVGPETADSMLLYAGDHSSFVIDTYTKRIFERHGWCDAEVGYDDLQSLCADSLSQKRGAEKLDYWRDYHAQLVVIGNRHCKPRDPNCDACPLKTLLPKE
ncbi:MAG: endonuclease III domain-containing protein [Verrucomicrobia subdivision 3 bacterium]|nr:endonuclease III domain-containing protein [Limisphaerales bacterium]